MRKVVVTIVAVAAVALAGWAHAAAPTRLDIEHFQFAPSTVTVTRGTSVTWINHDEETHAVTSATGAFSSPALELDQTFSHTFTQPGTYTYFCALHPHMRATIIVRGDQ
jgi:plastocyanin